MSPVQNLESSSSVRHACHCGKSFARKEHLTRHQATHEQPAYVCNVCQRRFTRRELLRRHSVLHNPNRTRSVISCDACRANKTKCSGGNPCTLCMRRAIDCTFQDKHHQRKDTSKDYRTSSENLSNRGDSDVNSSVPDNIISAEFLTSNSTHMKQAGPSHEWLQDLLIVPSKPVLPYVYEPLGSHMEAVYELLHAEQVSLEAALQNSIELQRWLSECCKSYFTHFHLRWPILNSPSFDATTASLSLAASVCVIGTWLSDEFGPEDQLWALRVHKVLLQRSLHTLIDPDSIPQDQPWPIQSLQSILLVLVFSLYRVDKSTLSEAMMLRSFFITTLRDKGMFEANVLADHLQLHFTGTYAPYAISMREQFRRVLILSYQFDVYFALAHMKPPLLHRQEIGTDLTITFALWNSHGLDVFAERLLDEPTGRTGFPVGAMTNSPGSFSISQLLVEDITLGLCGITQAIWVFMRIPPTDMKSSYNGCFQRLLLIEELDTWKQELYKIQKLANALNINSSAAKYLRLAYREKDDSAATILERVNILLQDSMTLYYCLKIWHYTGLQSNKLVGLVQHTKGPYAETWQTTKDGRDALACAFELLKMATSFKASNVSVNPLYRHALTMGSKLTQRLLTACKQCECLTEENRQVPERELKEWIETGGILCIDDIRVCICCSALLVEKFEEVIQNPKMMAETPDSIARS